MKKRYFLSLQNVPESKHEVSKEEWVRAERAAGFWNTHGRDEDPATGGFSGHGVCGSIRYEEISVDPVTGSELPADRIEKFAGLTLNEIAKTHKDNELVKALVSEIIRLRGSGSNG